MMFVKKPADFNSKFDIVSCFLERDGKFLILQIADHKDQCGTWGAPAGKANEGEDLVDATIRELFEESGVLIKKENLKYWGVTFVRYPKYDYNYYMYFAKCPAGVEIKINPKEHKSFKWVTPKEALEMNLMRDEDMSVKLFYKI